VSGPAPKTTEAEHEFGPALEIWEGFASDPELRFNASSGGILSALSLHCLEQEAMQFVLHTGTGETPWINQTVRSTNRAELLSRAGSRYAPSSPCDSLRQIEESEKPCVFVGKPCDAAAVSKLRQQRPKLDEKLGLVLTFFCAGTPSTKGTLDLINFMGVEHRDVQSVRYRGEGWPGGFKIKYGEKLNAVQEKFMTYAESWGRLTSYRSLRCNLCPDGLGRVADISCGDAWESIRKDDPGRSLVLVRSERGREILHRAMAAGYVTLERVDAGAVLAAQPSLLQRRREIFGRLLAMRLFAIPTPVFLNLSLSRSWVREPLAVQAQTVLGTMKRVVKRGWWKRRAVFDGT
jgi:coenzyme F420 hydrogenase subunit beta